MVGDPLPKPIKVIFKKYPWSLGVEVKVDGASPKLLEFSNIVS